MTEAETIRDLAAVATNTRDQDGTPYIVVPNGYEVKNLEAMLAHPARKRGKVALATLDSFHAYLAEQKLESSRVFAHVTESGATFVAVLDYHHAGKGSAMWGEHRATFTCQPTVEWTRWLQNNKRQMNQTQFSEFIEENLLAIVVPPGADLLELVQTLEGKKNVRFESTQRLSNGKTVLNYEEDIELKGNTPGGSNKGKLEFPTEWKLGIAPFKGTPHYAVFARVRHRIHERQMVFWYDLIDPHRVIETVTGEMIAQITEKAGLPVFHGQAP